MRINRQSANRYNWRCACGGRGWETTELGAQIGLCLHYRFNHGMSLGIIRKLETVFPGSIWQERDLT